jgi:hypothetical protein
VVRISAFTISYSTPSLGRLYTGSPRGQFRKLSDHSKRNFQNPRLNAAQFKCQRFFHRWQMPVRLRRVLQGCSGIALMHALTGHHLFQNLFIQSRSRFRCFWLPVEND